MLYMIVCHDNPDSVDLRMQTREKHLEYIGGAGDKLKLAGPILSEGDNPKPIGSLIVLEAASIEAVKIFADNDPYNRVGLFQNVEIRPWKAAVGTWVPQA